MLLKKTEINVLRQYKYLWNGKSKVSGDFGLGRVRVATLQNYKSNHNTINYIKFVYGNARKLIVIQWIQIELGLMQQWEHKDKWR